MAESVTPSPSMGIASIAMAKKLRGSGKSFASLQREIRAARLSELQVVTNSTAFRSGLDDGSLGAGAAKEALSALLGADADAVKMDQLTYVRHLGEGGFATVHLYEKELGGHKVKYAVKVMKDKMMAPPTQMYGEPRMVGVPEAERVRFYAEAVRAHAA